jgi:Ca2+-transporting ATPase
MTHSSQPGFKNAKEASTGAKADVPSIGESIAPWHTLTVADAATRLSADLKRGLSDSDAALRRKQYGLNALQESKIRSPFSILADQFKSLIVALLLAATVLAFVVGEHVEGAAVLVVIVLNAAVGFFTEWKAEQALSALQQQAAPSATVLRDGKPHELPSAQLVPGDIVILAAGERVPADGRVLDSVQLQIDEASLTGESHAVEKIEDVVAETNAPLGDRRNMAFLGTIITDGRGRLLITDTGPRTEMGRIGKLIEEAVSRETPLERKLAKLGNALIGVVDFFSCSKSASRSPSPPFRKDCPP